jgi:phospholipid/cholesterol/gamma-HCH transport system substrate-binding protein
MLPPLVGEAETLVSTLERLLARLDTRLMGTVGEPGGGLLATVDNTTREFGDLAAAVNQNAADLGAVVANLAAFSEHLADPDGLIPTLLGEEGTAAQLFHDRAALYERLIAATDQLVALTEFLNRSAPEIGILMDETIRTLAESEKVLQGLKNNPLLRGGIPPETEAPGTFEGRRRVGG